MSIKVDSVLQKDFVTLLSDVDVEFVSLVKHGANRVPFKILKSEVTSSEVAKEILDILKRLVGDQVTDTAKLSTDQPDATDLKDVPKDNSKKLNSSISDTHQGLSGLKESLAQISPADLENLSEDKLDDLKKVLQELQKLDATLKYDDGQARDDHGRFSGEGGGGSSNSPATTSQNSSQSSKPSKPTSLDKVHSKVTSTAQKVHDHAIVTGEIARKIASLSTVAATACTVLSAVIPHPAARVALKAAAKGAAVIAASAEATAVASHEVERELKPHAEKEKDKETKSDFEENKHPRSDNGQFSSSDGDSDKPQDDESATKHWDKQTLSSIDRQASKDGFDYLGVNGDGSLLYHNKKTDQLMNVAKDRKGQPQFDKIPMKSDSGGDMSLEVIHSIIQPIGKDIKALQEIYPDWFKNVKLSDKVEEADRITFVQKSDTAFDESAFRFVDAGFGLEFKVGRLKKTEKSDDALLIPTQINPMKADVVLVDDPSASGTQSANLNPDPMDTPIVEQPVEQPDFPPALDMTMPEPTETFTFGDMFQSKLRAFAAAVVAAMELSEDPATRRKIIQTFWKSFGNFLNAALDRVDASATKSEGELTTPTVKADDSATQNDTSTQTDTGGNDMSDMPATKEELVKLITDTVKEALKAQDAPKDAPKEPDQAATKTESDVDQLAEITQKLEGLTQAIKGFDTVKAELTALTEKTESLAHGTGPRRSWSEDVKSKTVTQKSDDPFNGVFTNL